MSLATLFAALLAAATFGLAVVLPSADPDTYWHLASAKWMVDHGTLLTRDPFSSTVSGVPYSVGEWAGELVWYGAYLAAGWPGIAILRAALVAIATFFSARTILLVQPRPLFAFAPLVAALLIGKTTWTDRPQLFTLGLFSVFVFVLVCVRAGASRRWLAILPPLVLLWTNLHGGYAIGLALVAIFALEALITRAPSWRVLLAVLVTCALASMLNPEAFGPFGAAGHVTQPPRFIAEELPPDLFTPQGFTFGLLIIAALATAILAGANAPLWAILLPPLVWLGLSAQRHLPLASIPLAAFVAESLPRAIARLWPAAIRSQAAVERVPRPAALVILLAAAVGGALAATAAPREPDTSAYPLAALGPLRDAPRELLNEYDWGGFLMWNAPEHPVFIDGRTFIYVPTVLGEFQRAVDLKPDFRSVLDARHISTVLLRPDRALVPYLRDAGWVVLAQGDRFVLLRRP